MSSDPAPVLEIVALGKSYGAFQAVTDLTLTVNRGELYALLGPNGAGKTTTLKMLMGVLKPTAGAARVFGHDCFRDRPEVMRHVGYLPDEPVFWDYLTGREILRFVGAMHGLAPRDLDTRAQAWLERFDLTAAMNEYAINYSKGMKKKLALVCALMHSPELLVLDEPTNGLDPYATRALHQMLREEALAGRTVLFSTHLLDQAERLSHRVGILSGGRLAAEGTLAELRAKVAAGDASLEEIFFAVTKDLEVHADEKQPHVPPAAAPAAAPATSPAEPPALDPPAARTAASPAEPPAAPPPA